MAVLLSVVTAVTGGAGPVGAATGPTVSLGQTRLVAGQKVTITGNGWPLGTSLQAQMCGSNAVNGSADCAQDAATQMSAARDGTIRGQMTVEVPPTPCPCVVFVQSVSGSFATTIPVTVAGASSAPVQRSVAAPSLAITGHLSGGASLASLFGAPAARTLTLTFANAGTAPEPHPVLTAGWGRSAGDRNVITTPAIGALTPGPGRVMTLHFRLATLARGRYVVTATIGGTGRPATFSASTATEPWALYALVGALVIAVVLTLRSRRRRRRRAAPPESGAAPETTVIDLRSAPPPPVVLGDRTREIALVGAAGAAGGVPVGVPGAADGAVGAPGAADDSTGAVDGGDASAPELLRSTGAGAVKDGGPATGGVQDGGSQMTDHGGWNGETHGVDPPAPSPEATPGTAPLDVAFDPGSELARAFDAVSAALRAETSRIVATHAEATQRQTGEIMDRARREAAELVERAAQMQETARIAVDRAGMTYEGVLRIIGQLSGGLSQIREQAAAEYEALRRASKEGTSPDPWPPVAGDREDDGPS